MLDGNHGRHAVPYIRAVEIGILVLQHPKLSGIGIHYLGELSLKAGDMRASLGIIDAVAEAQHLLVELIHILQCDLYGDPL